MVLGCTLQMTAAYMKMMEEGRCKLTQVVGPVRAVSCLGVRRRHRAPFGPSSPWAVQQVREGTLLPPPPLPLQCLGLLLHRRPGLGLWVRRLRSQMASASLFRLYTITR